LAALATGLVALFRGGSGGEGFDALAHAMDLPAADKQTGIVD
jgi:hypothetical protein